MSSSSDDLVTDPRARRGPGAARAPRPRRPRARPAGRRRPRAGSPRPVAPAVRDARARRGTSSRCCSGVQPSAASSTPTARSTSRTWGAMPSPQHLSRGKSARSSSSTRRSGVSARAPSAVAAPAGPAPTITRSQVSFGSPRGAVISPTYRAGGRGGSVTVRDVDERVGVEPWGDVGERRLHQRGARLDQHRAAQPAVTRLPRSRRRSRATCLSGYDGRSPGATSTSGSAPRTGRIWSPSASSSRNRSRRSMPSHAVSMSTRPCGRPCAGPGPPTSPPRSAPR